MFESHTTCPRCSGHLALQAPSSRFGWLANLACFHRVECAMCSCRYWVFGLASPGIPVKG
jgi:hypothetical protein